MTTILKPDFFLHNQFAKTVQTGETLMLADGRIVAFGDHLVTITDPDGTAQDQNILVHSGRQFTDGTVRDVVLVDSGDGGFKLIENSFAIGASDRALTVKSFDASGQLTGTKTFDGLPQFWSGTSLGDGRYVLTSEGTARFYNARDKIVRTVDANDQDGVLLSDGNVALISSRQTDATASITVHAPNGAKVARIAKLPGDFDVAFGSSISDQGAHINVIAGNGEFAVVNGTQVQRYTNDGTKIGRGFDIDLTANIANGTLDHFGLRTPGIYVADDIILFGYQVRRDGDSDIYVSLYRTDGTPIIEAEPATDLLTEVQRDVRFLRDPDGRVFLTYVDQNLVQMAGLDSIRAREVDLPDFTFLTDDDDTYSSGGQDNFVLSLGGNDSVSTGGGNDTVRAGAGQDTVYGGAGDDTLSGEVGGDSLSGDQGNDELSGGGGNDRLDGGSDDDRLFGNDGNDVLFGGAGDGLDQLYGGADDDRLFGGKGDDWLDGGDGNDVLRGSGGNDRLLGQGGNDDINGARGGDSIIGGDGDDIILGGGGSDRIEAGAGNDTVYGGSGSDTISAYGGGSDVIYGGGGHDIIENREGNDTLFGGRGEDTFVFRFASFGQDVIEDFRYGVDTLDMRNVIQNAGGSITVTDTDDGVLFFHNHAGSVLVAGADLDDFQDGDYLLSF